MLYCQVYEPDQQIDPGIAKDVLFDVDGAATSAARSGCAPLFNGARTGISRRCPGFPCSGFISRLRAFSGNMASGSVYAGATGAVLAIPPFQFKVQPPVADSECSATQAVDTTMSAEQKPTDVFMLSPLGFKVNEISSNLIISL